MKRVKWFEEEIMVKPLVGSYIEKDGLQGDRLLPCDDWDKAEFRWPNPIQEWREKHAIACNIEITGRTVRLIRGGSWVRVRFTWVGDDEPDTYSLGFMLVGPEERTFLSQKLEEDEEEE